LGNGRDCGVVAMSKTIKSPSERWAGSVTIADPLTLPQAEAIEAALDFRTNGGQVFLTVVDKSYLPAVFACVEKWELSNFPQTPDMSNIPMSPRKESSDLYQWIWGEIRAVYLGESTVPNE
jgi:hypothetical protein